VLDVAPNYLVSDPVGKITSGTPLIKTFTCKTKTSHHYSNNTLNNEYINSSYVSHTAINVILCQNTTAFQIDQDLQPVILAL